jgi:hypothetical protein
MRFEILKREIDVKWDHIFVVLGAFVAIALVAAIVSLLLVFISPGTLPIQGQGKFDFSTNFLAASAIVTSVFGLVGQPILAFAMLYLAGIFKMKKDLDLCRALASCAFVLGMVMLLISAFAGLVVGLYELSMSGLFVLLVSVLTSILSRVAGAIILYLWLLILLEKNIDRIKKVVVYALVFALALFLIEKAGSRVFEYAVGVLYPIEFGVVILAPFIRDFVFGLVILYHTLEKKIDKNTAALFTVAYLGSYTLSVISSFIYGRTIIPSLVTAALEVVGIGILYLLSRANKL